ncbi:metal dependent phosphohydrolase [Roseobacter sp. MED193]|uniref:HD domain-containing protein n=1 Tax=Roseobacter sp. MED193 TaxID=314262 RepID=UPI000068E3C6|nr:HD domain-containing protein [Roseobacter sp. MED193]EAQ43660.1 metal dependent phosphohydrolase [Roseobacter sp. MED193]
MIDEGVILPRDLPLWQDAKPYLDVRNNDEHTIVAYGLARALLAEMPQADESVVLPAILLHDVGWKRIDPELLLLAIGRNPTRKDLVREHEIHGVEIAREILERHRPEGVDVEAVLAIIDGHDTTKQARSVNDAVMKDADKGWRATPHGVKTICGWYDTSPVEHVETLEQVSNPYMLTAAGRAFAEGMCVAIKAEAQINRYMGEAADE